MASVKITVIGGGSYMWGPKIIGDMMMKKDELSGSQIMLHDLNSEALDLMYKLTQKMVDRGKADFKIERTTDLSTALSGADYVLLAISTGGLEAMRHDLEIPLRYGIYQSVGDTVGPGGLSRALRNIPVVVDICKKMESLCPEAWMLNYTNPMTTLCRAINRTTKIKTIGLCRDALSVLDSLKPVFGVRKISDLQVRVAGINHFAWILELKIKGEDGTPLLKNYVKTQDLYIKLKEMDWSDMDPFSDNNIVQFEVFKVFGYLPASLDRHLVEFFPHFLTKETEKGKKYGVKLTTIEHRLAKQEIYRRRIENMIAGRESIEIKRSGEKGIDIISAIANQKEEICIMNLPNKGQVSNLPEDAVLESFGVANANGAHGISVGYVPDGILSALYKHIINQELIVEAGLTGNRKLALQALMNDPLVTKWDDTEKMLDELLQANARYLPQF